jgi:GT2 family glycosyltransferase
MKRLAVVILNYRTADLTIECLRTLAPEIAPHDDRCAVVVDQNSGDDSADEITRAVDQNRWAGWVTLVRSPKNLGFAGGNNLGMQSVPAAHYMLFNSDARATPGCIDAMLDALAQQPAEIGAVGPRLQDPDGTPQISCFRYRTPLTEFLDAAGTGVLDRLFSGRLVPMGVFDEPIQPHWESFACIMLRREVIERVGPMDDQYFMYFEDIDYARRMRRAGYRMLHWPAARVVHLRGKSSSVKSAMKARKRVPRYYYQARSRYYAKFYGGVPGLWFTNMLWLMGRSIAWLRETFGRKTPDVCEFQGRDNWTNWLMPMQPPPAQKGGDL